GSHERPRVLRRRGNDDLQTRDPVEPGFRVLAVIRTRMAKPSPGHPHDHRHRATPAVSDLRRVVDELVEARGDEVVELHFAEGPLAGERRSDTNAEDGSLGER